MLKKSKFSKNSGNSVINQLVNEEFSINEKYKVISNGYHVYTERLYSLDERIVQINKPFSIEIGSYKLVFNLDKGARSDLFYDAKNINCKNKICEVMKENTINKK